MYSFLCESKSSFYWSNCPGVYLLGHTVVAYLVSYFALKILSFFRAVLGHGKIDQKVQKFSVYIPPAPCTCIAFPCVINMPPPRSGNICYN